MQFLKLISSHIAIFKWAVFIACLLPLLNLIVAYSTNTLGINKLDRLIDVTGIWALNLLMVTLAITPMRRWLAKLMIILRANYGKRLSDWNFLVKVRRTIGVFSFFYTMLHLAIYVWLDQYFDWQGILLEVYEKPYIAAGLIATLLLVPLAATSTDSAMRRLGRNWRRLHRLVYPIGILAVLHFLWLSKAGVYDAYPYTVILAVLLGYRFVAHYGLVFTTPRDDGMEVPERKP